MRVSKRFAVVLLCLALVVRFPAAAEWNPKPLPGIDNHVGAQVGLVGGVGTALIVGLLLHRHHLKSKVASGPVAIPSVLAFSRSETEEHLSIVNKGPSPLNVSEIVSDRGFSLIGVRLPTLIRGFEQVNFTVSRTAPFNTKRGKISFTLVESNGRTFNRLVELRAAHLKPAR